MNNNMNTERSLRDVFSTTSYVTIGEKDKALDYVVPTVSNHWYLPGVKKEARSCFSGKHFITNPGKKGTVPEVYLEKKYPWISDGDKYTDSMNYGKTQPEKKNGFASGDFRRKDEFTQNFRTEQYREALKSEFESTKKDGERRAKQHQELQSLVHPLPKATPYLYDLLDREDDGYPNKCQRDTKNPTIVSNNRNYGNWKTSSQMFGYGVGTEEHSKPEYARIPIIKKTFFRTQGISMSTPN